MLKRRCSNYETLFVGTKGHLQQWIEPLVSCSSVVCVLGPPLGAEEQIKDCAKSQCSTLET